MTPLKRSMRDGSRESPWLDLRVRALSARNRAGDQLVNIASMSPRASFEQLVWMLAAVVLGSAALAALVLLWLQFGTSSPWSPIVLWGGMLAWLGTMGVVLRRLE